MTATPAARTFRDHAPTDWAARRAQREADLLAAFDPTVPGIPGDGSPIVLAVDEERHLTYTWYDISRRPQDFQSRERGYLVSRLAVTCRTETGVDIEVAYLNVTHTTKELVATECPTPFHWADENTGAHYGFDFAAEDGATVGPEKIWATAYTHLSSEIGRPRSVTGHHGWGGYSADQAPTDPAVLAAELNVAEEHYAKIMRGFVRFLSVPFVDYAHVDNDRDAQRVPGHPGNLRGTGIGYRMYLLAAQHLATHNKILRASGCQTEQAQALWARLVADPAVPTRRTRTTFYLPIAERVQAHWCIDYTRHPATGDTDD